MSQSFTHRIWQVLWISLGFAVAGGNFTVLAGSITINNNSFEDPALAKGGSTIRMPNWILVGGVGDQGIFINDGTAGFGGVIKNVDGKNASYILGNGANGYLQITSAKFSANSSYTMTAAVGLQTNSTLDAGNLSLEIVDGKNSTVLATMKIAFNDAGLKMGALTDYSVTLADGTKFAGDPFEVEIVADGKATKGNWIVDNIRASFTPEPSTLVLSAEGTVCAISFLALAYIRRGRGTSSRSK